MMMKSIVALTAALLVAKVSAAGYPEDFDGYSPEACGPILTNCAPLQPIHRPCPNPCNLNPNSNILQGLGTCECPKKCSALWFNRCDGCSSGYNGSNASLSGIGAECRSFEKDCRVQCLGLDWQQEGGHPSKLGKKVFGVCVGYSSYQRPLCLVPGSQDACKLDEHNQGTLVLHNGRFECVKEVPQLLVPGQYEVCPLGYYPSCFIIDDCKFTGFGEN